MHDIGMHILNCMNAYIHFAHFEKIAKNFNFFMTDYTAEIRIIGHDISFCLHKESMVWKFLR